MKKVVLLIFIVLLIAGTIWRIVIQRRESASSQEKISSIPVKVESPKYDYIEETISLVGDIKGEDQTTVYPEAPGQLLEYKVKEGDWAEKDTVLALIDRAQTGMDFEPLKVKSPISGVVGRIYLDKGTNVSPQTAIALVAKMDKVKIDLNIPEKYLPKVEPGQDCRIKVEVYPEKIFAGKVQKVSPVLNPQDRTFYVEIILDNPGQMLRPGMFCEAAIVVAARKGILLSNETIIRDYTTGKDFVFVLENGIALKREVKLGIVRTDTVEIISGVRAKDKIIAAGHEFLQGSEKVQVVE